MHGALQNRAPWAAVMMRQAFKPTVGVVEIDNSWQICGHYKFSVSNRLEQDPTLNKFVVPTLVSLQLCWQWCHVGAIGGGDCAEHDNFEAVGRVAHLVPQLYDQCRPHPQHHPL